MEQTHQASEENFCCSHETRTIGIATTGRFLAGPRRSCDASLRPRPLHAVAVSFCARSWASACPALASVLHASDRAGVSSRSFSPATGDQPRGRASSPKPPRWTFARLALAPVLLAQYGRVVTPSPCARSAGHPPAAGSFSPIPPLWNALGKPASICGLSGTSGRASPAAGGHGVVGAVPWPSLSAVENPPCPETPRWGRGADTWVRAVAPL
jgi:hypothetical protein